MNALHGGRFLYPKERTLSAGSCWGLRFEKPRKVG